MQQIIQKREVCGHQHSQCQHALEFKQQLLSALLQLEAAPQQHMTACWIAGKDIEKACQGIYPLQSVYIRKVKVLRTPKFDVTKLMEVRSQTSDTQT